MRGAGVRPRGADPAVKMSKIDPRAPTPSARTCTRGVGGGSRFFLRNWCFFRNRRHFPSPPSCSPAAPALGTWPQKVPVEVTCRVALGLQPKRATSANGRTPGLLASPLLPHTRVVLQMHSNITSRWRTREVIVTVYTAIAKSCSSTEGTNNVPMTATMRETLLVMVVHPVMSTSCIFVQGLSRSGHPDLALWVITE
jgi:hypothetical protein